MTDTAAVFLRRSAKLIRERAKRAQSQPIEAAIDLAALLFTIAIQLSGKHNLAAKKPVPFSSLAELLISLAGLPAQPEAQRLYDLLISALATIENEFSDPLRDAAVVRGVTRIEDLYIDGVQTLGGVVKHWPRPDSALQRLREKRDQLAGDRGESKRTSRRLHPAAQLRTLGMDWDCYPTLPPVNPVESGDRVVPLRDLSGDRAARERNFRIALCPLAGDFHPRFQISSCGRYFTACRVDPIQGRDALNGHLDAIVKSIAEARRPIHLLLLPELNLDLQAREYLLAKLRALPWARRPYGTIAGSFHIWPEDSEDCLAEDPGPANEAILFGPDGLPLLKHRKWGQFRITPALVLVSPEIVVYNTTPEGKSKAAPLATEIFEGIQYGRSLSILETSLGRLAMLICADAIEPDPRGYIPVIERLRPDLLLLVAMSRKTSPFERLFTELARHRISSVFVNAACFCSPGAILAAADLALHQSPGDPPTRIRWRAGEQSVETFDFTRQDGRRRGWQQLPQGDDGAGFDWLRSVSSPPERLGLVLDLGAQWPRK